MNIKVMKRKKMYLKKINVVEKMTTLNIV